MFSIMLCYVRTKACLHRRGGRGKQKRWEVAWALSQGTLPWPITEPHSSSSSDTKAVWIQSVHAWSFCQEMSLYQQMSFYLTIAWIYNFSLNFFFYYYFCWPNILNPGNVIFEESWLACTLALFASDKLLNLKNSSPLVILPVASKYITFKSIFSTYSIATTCCYVNIPKMHI